jgi:glycosyltransferase involved in cell wall biosynthesis
MSNLGLVISDNANFLNYIRSDLEKKYKVSEFQFAEKNFPVMSSRINSWRYKKNWQRFTHQQDVLFFEWAGEQLARASHLQKSAPVLVRLLGYELYHWAPHIDWNYVDVITVPLRWVKKDFGKYYSQYADKCEIIPTGIDIRRFDPTPMPFRGNLGILGYISPRKRVYELILSFADMISTGLDLNLYIAGNHDQRYQRDFDPIQLLPSKLGIQDRVHFEGFVPSTTEWLKKIDIFISNSYSETQHVALQEAMASACYCLAHFWPGVEEYMPAGNIFGTPNDLLQKVNEFVALSEKQKMQQKSALLSVVQKEFDYKNVNIKLLDIIDKLLIS